MKFGTDEYREKVMGFTPTTGVTLSGTYLKEGVISEVEVFKLANDVEVTLDGVAVMYDAGDLLILRNGVSYTFSAPVGAHKM